MPRFNNYWATYGCENCNNYGLYPVIMNWGDTKSEFREWMNQKGVRCPSVSKDEGSHAFCTIVNEFAAGPTYMIKPDRTYESTSNHGWYESDITSLGILAHNCFSSSIANNKAKNNKLLHSFYLRKNSLEIRPYTNGKYEVRICSVKGQVLYSNKDYFYSTSGVKLKHNLMLIKGVYVVTVRTEHASISKRVVVR